MFHDFFQDLTDSDGEISNYYLPTSLTPQSLSQVIVFLTLIHSFINKNTFFVLVSIKCEDSGTWVE